MRRLVIRRLAALGLVTAAMILGLTGFSDAMAQGDPPEQPWCIIFGGSQGSVEECGLRTFEECREEAIAGNRGSCFPNPRFQDNRLPRSGRARRALHPKSTPARF